MDINLVSMITPKTKFVYFGYYRNHLFPYNITITILTRN